MATAAFLRVHNVHKHFARVHAVDGVSLSVGRGEIFALLGPNGAGKSTLLRMLVGITRPDQGTITWERELQPSDLGYLPEDRGLYQDMPVARVLGYFGRLRGLTAHDADRAAHEWLERLELADRARDKVSTLSKGNQQKVQFAAAVLHRPAFAILDEPFSGLDPLNQEAFLGFVRALREGGTTVLLSAHQMALVERLADRVFVMQHGREVLHGTLAEIRARWGAGDRLVLQVQGDPQPGIAALQGLPAVRDVVRTAADTVTISLAPGHHVGDVLSVCARDFVIETVRTEQPSLHDVYIAQLGPGGASSEAA